MKLREPYQRTGFNTIFSAWDETDVVFFVLATGGGKTVTFVEVIKKLLADGKRGMLIAHREELISQAWNTLAANGVKAGIIKGDTPTNYALPCQVCSIQTLARRRNLPEADFIVIDEGHHAQPDNTYGAVLKRYPGAKVLVVSATPYRLSGKGFVNLVPDKITKLVVNCTLPQLIEDGWLVPIKYLVASMPDMSGVDLVKGEYEESGTEKAMMLAPLVESYQKHVKGLSGICFCVTVNHSISVAQQYNAAGIPAAHIDANTATCKTCYPGCGCRRDVLQKFKAGVIKIVCNVGILTEGTDCPNCDFVQFAAPTKSLSKALQEAGRVTRALAGIVDSYPTPAERKAAIAFSKKPHGIILDNAGLWRDHGFPTDARDWEMYFNGWEKQKKKKKEPDEYIEIPIFEIEDPLTGARRKTKNENELPGMILVEITKELQLTLKASQHIQELYRYIAISRKKENINKPGYWAYYQFRSYCKTHKVQLTDFIWKQMRVELVDNVNAKVEAYMEACKKDRVVAVAQMNTEVEAIKKTGVHRGFLRREYEEWVNEQSIAANANNDTQMNNTLQGMLKNFGADALHFG